MLTPLITPGTLLSIRRLMICNGYRQVPVTDQELEQKYGRHSVEQNARNRQTFVASL